MGRKLTKGDRDSLRNDYQTDDVTVIAALDDLDASDEEIRQLTIDADTVLGEYERLRDTVGSLRESHDNLVKENAQLRRTIVSIKG